jgi:hypothetical protein
VIEDYRGNCKCLKVVNYSLSYTKHPVLLELLDYKVMYCNMTRATPESCATPGWLFVPYSNTQSTVDPRLE